jgi:hypothetical protein
VDCEVFKNLSKEDMRQYNMNYITIVEAYKSSLFDTTPLKICMISSMNPPPPSGVILNDCLLKGPPALADLYTVQ